MLNFSGIARTLIRLFAVWFAVLLVLEWSRLGTGGEGGHSLKWFSELVSGEFLPGVLWRNALWIGTLSSLGVTILAMVVALAFGPVLGVLAARFRRGFLIDWLLAPVFAAAWLPAFWLILLGVWWQVEWRAHPGYADAAPAVGGPVGIEAWWQRAQIALVVALGPIAWQIRSLSEDLRRGARAPHVRAARQRGVTGAALFFRHVFPGSLGMLFRGADRWLPAMLGAQIVVEWAFRFPGLGRLTVEAARTGDFTGLLGGGLVLGSAVVLAGSAGQMLHGSLISRPL